MTNWNSESSRKVNFLIPILLRIISRLDRKDDILTPSYLPRIEVVGKVCLTLQMMADSVSVQAIKFWIKNFEKKSLNLRKFEVKV